MNTAIRIIAQHYNPDNNEVIEESLLRDDRVVKPEHIKELGYLHVNQIDLLQKSQDFMIGHQIKLVNTDSTCPKCGGKTRKQGQYKSKFHAILTDHVVNISRVSCLCGCSLPYTTEGLYGSNIHPELLEKQALFGAQKSYAKTADELNHDAAVKRSVNNHSNIHKVVKKVGDTLEAIKTEVIQSQNTADKLVAVIDGGHVAARGSARSFESMLATVYEESNVVSIDRHHNKIINKATVASSKDDGQKTMKKLFKHACLSQGMGKDTVVTCIADGADNCWAIADSIAEDCREVIGILDWFHIGMKFKNNASAVPSDLQEKYDKVKWHLWHGRPETALLRLEQLCSEITDNKALSKLEKIRSYIANNKDKILKYKLRQKKGLVYTSNTAESTVSHLINSRQKNKQRMRWTREGSHTVLQIRASLYSETWSQDWEKVESRIYKNAA